MLVLGNTLLIIHDDTLQLTAAVSCRSRSAAAAAAADAVAAAAGPSPTDSYGP